MRRFLLFLFSLFLAIHVYGKQIPVAILSRNGNGYRVLTFTYADESTATAKDGEFGTYAIGNGNITPDWWSKNERVSKVIFTKEFANAKPTSTMMWFANMSNLTEIDSLV